MPPIILTIMLLSVLSAVTLPRAHAQPTFPTLRGWGGIGVGEAVQNNTGPPSAVFSGQKASNMEQAFANMSAMGFNTERIVFMDPISTCGGSQCVPNSLANAAIKNSAYSNANLTRAIQIASYFHFYVVLNEHQNCDFANATSACEQNISGTFVNFTNTENQWLGFWQSNVTAVVHTVGWTGAGGVLYEPLNEPFARWSTGTATGLQVNDVKIITYPGPAKNIYPAYKDFLSTIRTTEGDTTHWIVIDNAQQDGDFPAVQGLDSADMTVLSHHFYYQYGSSAAGCTTPGHVVPSYPGGSYAISTYCGWSSQNAALYADNVTAYMISASGHFGLPIFSTESGADYVSTTPKPPDNLTQNTGPCKYATSTDAFIQELTADFSAVNIGYELWMNGDWGYSTTHSIFGCMSDTTRTKPGYGNTLAYLLQISTNTAHAASISATVSVDKGDNFTVYLTTDGCCVDPASGISDSQSNSFIDHVMNTQGTIDFWTTTPKSSGSDTVTITLYGTLNAALIIIDYRGLIVGGGANVVNQSPSTTATATYPNVNLVWGGISVPTSVPVSQDLGSGSYPIVATASDVTAICGENFLSGSYSVFLASSQGYSSVGEYVTVI